MDSAQVRVIAFIRGPCVQANLNALIIEQVVYIEVQLMFDA